MTDRQRLAVIYATAGIPQRQAAKLMHIARGTLVHHLEAAEHRLGLEGA